MAASSSVWIQLYLGKEKEGNLMKIRGDEISDIYDLCKEVIKEWRGGHAAPSADIYLFVVNPSTPVVP
jgi:hypothetical protein